METRVGREGEKACERERRRLSSFDASWQESKLSLSPNRSHRDAFEANPRRLAQAAGFEVEWKLGRTPFLASFFFGKRKKRKRARFAVFSACPSSLSLPLRLRDPIQNAPYGAERRALRQQLGGVEHGAKVFLEGKEKEKKEKRRRRRRRKLKKVNFGSALLHFFALSLVSRRPLLNPLDSPRLSLFQS